MGFKEDILEMKKEVKEMQEQSLAMELLRDSKRANIRICRAFTTVIILVLLLWATTIGYLIYVLNDIETEETTTEEIVDMDAEGSNNYVGGDNSGTITNN